MTMLAEHYDYVIGGDPDRDTVDLAVIDTATAGVRAHLCDRTDAAGYVRVLTWARNHAPGRRVWALEGTGSFACGLVTALAEAGEQIVEITGGKRGRGAKNDRIDASRRHAARCPASTRPLPGPGGYVRRYAKFSLPGRRFWSAGPRPSTR